jgi:hypothetical protein
MAEFTNAAGSVEHSSGVSELQAEGMMSRDLTLTSKPPRGDTDTFPRFVADHLLLYLLQIVDTVPIDRPRDVHSQFISDGIAGLGPALVLIGMALLV